MTFEKNLTEVALLQDTSRPSLPPATGHPASPSALRIFNLSFFYSTIQALRNITLDIPRHEVTAFIGPSGCGKSTLLRCINRLSELTEGARLEGDIYLNGDSIYDRGVDVTELRRRVGMVFQKSNPFPKTIYENVAYGPRVNGVGDQAELNTIVEQSLREAAL